MPRLSNRPHACHLGHITRPGTGPTAVWICEYPYRTIRLNGPSSDCADCPIWQAMEQSRGVMADAEATADIRELEAMIEY